MAVNRALIHPNGADYRIKDTHYKDKFSKFSEHNRISLKPLIIDSKNSFSDSIQTLKLNDSHYVMIPIIRMSLNGIIKNLLKFLDYRMTLVR